MERRGILFYLRPGMRDEYLWCHQNPPEELLATLRRAGISDYTIWNYDDKLFATYKVQDPAVCDEVLASSPVYRQWREKMESIVYVDPQTGQKEWMMDLMFLLV